MLFRKIIIILFCIFIISYKAYTKIIDENLEYQDLNDSILSPWAHIHVFSLNPKNYNFTLSTAKDLGKQHTTIANLTAKYKNTTVIAINGGFFDKQYKPLGLRVNNNKITNPIKKISWWGIFYVNNKIPKISNIYKYNENIIPQLAMQSGPRLVINGEIPKLKKGIAERSALCITNDNKLVILATENMPMSTKHLAKILKNSLNCKNALNLDGGSSTQLFAKTPQININSKGFAEIIDAIVVSSVD